MQQKKRTKIVCTIGPASKDPEVMEKMVAAGMNVCRLNFSHGTHEDHERLISTIRMIAEKTGEKLTILQDLQGPKIRCGDLPEEGVELVQGEEVVFTTEPDPALPKIGLTYDGMHNDVKPGDRLLLDDGLLDVEVIEIKGRDIVCRVTNGGTLTSHKGMNLPTATLNVPAITEKDKEDLRFGVKIGVDWVALSFVRDVKDIRDLKALIKEYEKELGDEYMQRRPIKVIAKIEKHQAVKNIDAIMEVVDGIMVARGDLGVEMPAEKVPLIQKMLIDKCRVAAKPVIVATQMLDSMIKNPRATRAEVSDVANAVIDHTDAVMLSGESATGKFPVEAVETLTRIVSETERSVLDDVAVDHKAGHLSGVEDAVSEVAGILAKDTGAKLILAASISGSTGRNISRFRPELPIIVATDDERVRNQLNLSWGVQPFLMPRVGTIDELVEKAVDYVKKEKWVRAGDSIILIAGQPVGKSGGANFIEVKEIS